MMLKGLVLAGGEGTRLRPFTYSMPKHLIPLLGKAMIEYPICHLVDVGIKDIGIVVGYLGHLIKEYLGDGSRYGARFTYIRQERRLGIAHAIHISIANGFIEGPFVVYLGDNILAHGIEKYVESFITSEPDVYILLCKVKDPSRFGVAIIEDNKIVKLVEKPKQFLSDMAMIGIYFFRDPDLVEKAFSSLKLSWRGEYEITELIQWFIDHGYTVKYDIVTGWWKDVGTPESLLEALYLLLDNVQPRIKGKVEGEVQGRVIVEKGAVIEGKVYGPAYVGRDTYIAKNATIEHYVSVESRSKILSGSVTRSIILNNSTIDLNKARLVDSIIGNHCYVKAKRELYGAIRLAIGDYGILEL